MQDVSSVYDNFELENGTKLVLDVAGEEFKLVVEYLVDLEVYTEGLTDGTKVYIDNVHISLYYLWYSWSYMW